MREISETDKSETPSSLLHSTVIVQSLVIRLFLQPLGNVMSSFIHRLTLPPPKKKKNDYIIFLF